MSKRAIILFEVLFILVIVGMFVFTYLKHTEQTIPHAVPVFEAPPFQAPLVARVDAKQYYEDGVYTFAGIIDMPTPCHLLEASTTVAETIPHTVTINFSVINNAENCVKIVTPQRFKVAANASIEAPVRATWDGVPIELNIIPAAPGETPDEFELFIKG